MVLSSTTVVLRSGGPGDTRALAAALAPLCRTGDVLLLVGDLGAGKTTFAQGFGAALGVAEPIVSPTFTLVRQYPLPTGRATSPGDGAGPVRQYIHADLYRLSSRNEIEDLGLRELVEDYGVALVEWGDAAEPVLADDWLRVDLEFGETTEDRTVRCSAHGGTWPERWPELVGAVRPWERSF